MASTRTQQQAGREMSTVTAVSSIPNAKYGSPVHQSQLSERPLHCQTPIPEEDESNSTASEAPEPVTPTNDSTPPALPRRHGTVENGVAMQLPEFLKAKPIDFAPMAKRHPPPSTRPNESPRQQTAPQKTTPITKTQTVSSGETTPNSRPGIGIRTRSFLRNKLHRTSSNKETTQATSNASSGDAERQQALEEFRINVEGTIPTPKKRRGLSWSGRNSTSTRSSNSNSPPSPGSPQMTMNERQLGHQPAQPPRPAENNARLHHSRSSMTLNNFGPKQPSTRLTWGAPTPRKSRPPAPPRRRSASTDLGSRNRSPGPHSKGPTIGMLDTFSKPAAAGAGLKARRLSLSLPDEFTVDYCELDNEFKSSSLMPGKRGKRIGAGATAEVRIMLRKGASDELYAVKEYRGRDKDEKEEEYVKKIKSEYSIAKSLHHPNIVETVRLCTHSGRWNHVMEYCAYGELFTQVEKGVFRTHYKLEDRNCLFKQLLRGVCYLHDHGIAHRDIKLENLLQTSDGFLKISDFGVSEVFSGVHPGLREAGGQCGVNMGEVRLCPPGICGSGPYIAPEVWLKQGDYDPRPLDVWSCAIVYLTMTYGGLPWQASDPKFTHYARFKKGWDDWLERHPDGLIKDEPDGQPKCGPLFANLPTAPIKRLLLKMLHPDPSKRISAQDALNTPCINAIECCCPESYDDPKCCIDASRKGYAKKATRNITRKHHHVPPKEEKAKFLRHRFDMGDGWA